EMARRRAPRPDIVADRQVTTRRRSGAADDDRDRAADAGDQPARDELLEIRWRPTDSDPDEQPAGEEEHRAGPQAIDVAARHDRGRGEDPDRAPGRRRERRTQR